MLKPLCAAALAAGMFVALAVTAAPSVAIPTCSIVVPARVYIASGSTTITAYPGADCRSNGMTNAGWDVAPSALGDSFYFTSEPLISTYTFYSILDTVGVLHAVATGASSSDQFNDLHQTSPTFAVKYATYAFAASSRQGAAVYVNGLVHQWSSNDLVSGSGREAYLQRFLYGGWQTMLSRTTDASGKMTVRFVQHIVYQYRLLVTETATAWNGRSASTFR